MSFNMAQASALGAAGEAIHGVTIGAGGTNGQVPVCPANQYLPIVHDADSCLTNPKREEDRGLKFNELLSKGQGATLIPNERTVICPQEVQDLSIPSAQIGFDVKWIVENTSSTPVVLAWLHEGKEYSPFHTELAAIDDPDAVLQPGHWKAVPTYQGYVYHAREFDVNDGGAPGPIVLQHRAGLVPLGNHKYECDASLPDVEPINPDTGLRTAEFARRPTPPVRRCNTLDVGFRNQVGCPLHVYWAANLEWLGDVPSYGFTCGEKFTFHMGTKPATQDFLHDWESTTKYEGTFIGHTFIARLASDPNVVVDTYTVEATKVIDCPNLKKQQVIESDKEEIAVQQEVANQEGSCDADSSLNEAQLPNHVGAAATLPDALPGSL